MCEKFVNGLCDLFLRKEVKKLFRIKFIEFYIFWDEIIVFSEEEEIVDNIIVILIKLNMIND